MSETNGVAEWLYTTLAGGTALTALVGTRIYEDFAPAGAARPCVCFQMVSAGDVLALHGNRAATDQEWIVYGVTDSMTYNAVKPIADAIDNLLHAKAGTATINGVTVKCVRTESLRYSSVEDGKVWRYMGGYYHIFAGST